MQHSTPTRIICNDGLQLVGGYDEDRSNQHKIYLLGHIHFTWRSNIREAFLFIDGKWTRYIGTPNVYDHYIQNGGQLWPDAVMQAVFSDDLC